MKVGIMSDDEEAIGEIITCPTCNGARRHLGPCSDPHCDKTFCHECIDDGKRQRCSRCGWTGPLDEAACQECGVWLRRASLR